MTEIICSGFGGQGVLVAGMILADAGMEDGKNVTWYPSYGSEMRGGTANCNIKISEEEIPSPYCHQLDILYTLNDAAIDKFESQVRPGGILLVNSSLARKDRVYREDIQVIKVPATDIANELGNARGTNIVMLGALSYASPDFDVTYMRGAIDYFFAKKGKVNPKNALCIPRDSSATVRLYKNDMETDAKTLFYEQTNGDAFVIGCNVSDIFPDVTVSITSGGETVDFSPFISLKDGSVQVGERGLDITRISTSS